MADSYRGIFVARKVQLPEWRNHVPKARVREKHQQCSMRQSATVPRSCLILTYKTTSATANAKLRQQTLHNVYIYVRIFLLGHSNQALLSPPNPRFFPPTPVVHDKRLPSEEASVNGNSTTFKPFQATSNCRWSDDNIRYLASFYDHYIAAGEPNSRYFDSAPSCGSSSRLRTTYSKPDAGICNHPKEAFDRRIWA
jgi:hypothetical protein